MDFPDIAKVFNYKEVEGYYAMQLSRASWGAAAINIAIVILVSAVMQGIALVVSTALSGVSAAFTQQSLAPTVVEGGINFLSIGAGAVAGFIGFFLSGLLLHALAKALGGRGSALQLIYLLSVGSLAMVPVTLAIQVLYIIPCLCCAGALLGLALGIYGLYLSYVSVKVAHQMESTKALIALVLWLVAVAAILIALYVVLMIFVFGSAIGLSYLFGK